MSRFGLKSQFSVPLRGQKINGCNNNNTEPNPYRNALGIDLSQLLYHQWLQTKMITKFVKWAENYLEKGGQMNMASSLWFAVISFCFHSARYDGKLGHGVCTAWWPLAWCQHSPQEQAHLSSEGGPWLWSPSLSFPYEHLNTRLCPSDQRLTAACAVS